MRFALTREGTKNPSRVSGNNGIGGDVLGHDAPGPNYGMLTDGHLGQDRGAGADGGAFLDDGLLDLPVCLCLQLATRGCTRIGIVDEHDAVADEDVVLNCHAFADERMARDLAAASDRGVLLNLDECADLRFVADLAAV